LSVVLSSLLCERNKT